MSSSRTPVPPGIDLTLLPFDIKTQKHTLENAVKTYESAVTQHFEGKETTELLNSLYVRTVYHQKAKDKIIFSPQQHEYLVFEVVQHIPGLEIHERPRMFVRFERCVAPKEGKKGKKKDKNPSGHQSGEETATSPGDITSEDDASPNTRKGEGEDGEHSKRPIAVARNTLPTTTRRANESVTSIDKVKMSSGYSYGAGDYVSFRDYHRNGDSTSKILHSFTFLEEEEPDGDGSNQPLNFKPSQTLRASTQIVHQAKKSTVRLTLHDALLAAYSITHEFPDYNVYTQQCFFFASLLWTLLIDPQSQRGRLEIREGKTLSGTVYNGKVGFPFIPPQQDHLERVQRKYKSEQARFLAKSQTAIQHDRRGEEEAKKRESAEAKAKGLEQLAAEEVKKRQSAEQLAAEEARKRVEAEKAAEQAAERIRALEAALEASKKATTSSA